MFLFFVTDRVHFRHSRGLTASAKHAVARSEEDPPVPGIEDAEPSEGTAWLGPKFLALGPLGWAQFSEQNLVAGTACLSSENLDFESLQVGTFDFQTLH